MDFLPWHHGDIGALLTILAAEDHHLAGGFLLAQCLGNPAYPGETGHSGMI